ncbi:MAG: flippase-like domain-containing protein [Flavobacteriales bacterium]|nr:flippase-like domain-containing protein [Flavobacteriales bacterium]
MTRRTLLLLRWCVFFLAFAFLYVRLSDGPGLAAFSVQNDVGGLTKPVVIVLLLMLVNWGLESRKWRLLVRGLEPISIARSFIATIAGTAIGLITPNRVGEFAGRVLFLAPEHRIAGAFATVVGSIAQFVVTVSLGMMGFIATILTAEPDYADPMAAAWIGLGALVAFSSLLLYFNPQLLHALVARLPLVKRWERHAAVLDRFSGSELRNVLLLSLARYAVFTIQFMLLLHECAGLRAEEAITAIPVVFLIGTLIPTVMLTELGVRGSVAVAFFNSGAHDAAIIMATTALWLVNIALPAMAGAVILLVARIRSARA